jgi:SulP family sulfate permease
VSDDAMNVRASHWLQDVVAGAVIAIVVLALAGSYTLLIFSHPISEYSAWGVRITLVSAVIIGAWTAWKSCFFTTISIPQDRVAPILGFMSASLIASMSPRCTPQTILATLIVSIAGSTLLTGVLLFVLGRFRLANLTRYIPYPVVGGFLAGSGWLLVIGSIRATTGEPIHMATVITLFTSAKLVPWLPCAVFGIGLFAVQLRAKHWSVFLLFFGGCTVGFYIFLAVTGSSIETARDAGWLIPRFVQTSHLSFDAREILQLAEWKQLPSQAGSFAAIAIIAVVSILLNSSAMEIDTEQEIDLNQELRTAGVGNMLAGCAGGMTGFSSLSLTRLARHMGVRSRLAGWTMAVVCGLCLFANPQIVGYIPKFILGGILLYLGMHFLHEWVYLARTRVPSLDYAAILIILVVIATAGYIQGVMVGLLTATILFVVNYSRIHVVTQALTGAQQHSNVDRPLAQQKLLRSIGSKIHILKLQGFIFFGSASSFLSDIRERLHKPDTQRLEFVILDFRRVHGLDSSAVLALRKLLQQAEAFDFILIFCSVSPEIATQMNGAGFPLGSDGRFFVHRDRDHALEWCENRLIEEQATADTQNADLEEQLRIYWPQDGEHFADMVHFLDRQEIPAGEYLMLQGDPADELYFIEKGKVTVQLELQNGAIARLRTMNSGTVVGELGLYLGEARTASIVADELCVVYRLSRENLKRMQREKPGLASAFNLFMVRLLADRLLDTSKILQSVLE